MAIIVDVVGKLLNLEILLLTHIEGLKTNNFST